jgi:anti-anti-sigma factor
MKISTQRTDGKSVIRIEGDLLIGGVAEAKSDLAASMDGAPDILLDLGGLEDCDTAGLQLLLMARASARTQGKTFAVTARSTAFEAIVRRLGIADEDFQDQERTPN